MSLFLLAFWQLIFDLRCLNAQNIIMFDMDGTLLDLAYD